MDKQNGKQISFEPIVTLRLRRHTKNIPYHSQERETFEASNHGFKLLKGRPEEIAHIPEAQDNPHIIRALTLINDERSAFFSVGCEKAFNYEPPNVHWARGFIEFSFNLVEWVTDASIYFALFFQFNNAIWEKKFNLATRFDWEIDRAIFLDANKQPGFTNTVWITTQDFETAEEAKKVWETSLDFLANFLVEFAPDEKLAKIYK